MPAEARLVSSRGPDEGGEHRVVGEATIGRDPANTIVLAAPGISARHARIRYEAEQGAWVLEDLGSLNGTELDGLPVTRPEPLGALHAIEFGGIESFLFVAGGEVPAAEEGDVEGTRVERLAPELPAELARRAGEAAGEDVDATRVERRPTPLPGALGERLRRGETDDGSGEGGGG